jgi:hypothetical protein
VKSETFKNFFKIALFPLAVYIVNDLICRVSFSWYEMNNVDTYIHFIGGLSIAFSINNALTVLEKENLLVIKRKLVKVFFIVAAVAFVAVLWEIYEFTWDLNFGTHLQPSNFDTIKDLIMGTLGGLLFCFHYIITKPKTKADINKKNG